MKSGSSGLSGGFGMAKSRLIIAANLMAAGSYIATGHRTLGWLMLGCLLAAWGLLIRLGIRSTRPPRHGSLMRESDGVWRSAQMARADESTTGRLLWLKWGLDSALAVRASKKGPRWGKGKPAAVRGEATLDHLLRCKQTRGGGGNASEPTLWDRQIDA